VVDFVAALPIDRGMTRHARPVIDHCANCRREDFPGLQSSVRIDLNDYM